MKIIDRETGKRIVHPFTSSNKEKINRKPIKDLEQEEHSPMDPPEAYDLNFAVNDVLVKDMNPFLQNLIKEHVILLEELAAFEKFMIDFKNSNYNLTKEISEGAGKFFMYFDDTFLDHVKREEKILFPTLDKKLLQSGEHSANENNPHTAVDLMEDDHISFIQSATLIFNMLGLAARIKDGASRAVICDLAYHNAMEFIENMKLHTFKEDHTIFPLAHQLISKEEFAQIL